MEVYSGDESLTSEEREELRDTLLEDRGPAYMPWMVKEFGPHAGLFMSQLLFWDGKGHDPNGWIYKTEKEMEQETGLTRSSQRRARKILVGKGVLEEDKRGLPRRLHYRADLRALMAILNGEASTGQNAHASEEGNSRLTDEEAITFLTGEEITTSPTSEESTKFPASEEGSTDPAYTENTSEIVPRRVFREKIQENPPYRVARIKNSRHFTKKKRKKTKGLSKSSATHRDASQNPHQSRRSPVKRARRNSLRELIPLR